MKLPETLSLNAFTGDDAEVVGNVAPRGNRWGSRPGMLSQQAPLAPVGAAKLGDWSHSDIGWGVVLPDTDDWSPQEKARALDAPKPIQDLVEARSHAPVFRYRAELEDQKLARYFDDGSRQDPEIGLSVFGTEKGRLPLYLLIVGSPADVPWRLQYALNRRHHVGRLDLPPDGLSNYVKALISDWHGMESDATETVVWSVSYDSITKKMDATIASLIYQRLKTDDELTINRIENDNASCDELMNGLAAAQPAVVVTCSHGKTGPLNNAAAMRKSLGLPVDVNRNQLDIEALLDKWQPSGAIWYAQACCSAGSNDGTSFEGLLDPQSSAHKVVSEVGQLGSGTAPLPTRLLGAQKPLRAFIGHVEPTFDWTLIAGDTGQFLTAPLADAIYPNLYRRCPLGLSLDAHYRGVGELYGKLKRAIDDVNNMVPDARDAATYFRLTAIDRESLVILGDPTVVVPPLPTQIADGVTSLDCVPEP